VPFPIYLDEDSMSRALRSAGFDVLSTNEAGMGQSSDEEQLDFAARSGRALYTASRQDFSRLHAKWLANDRQHCGIICNNDQRLATGARLRAFEAIAELLSPDQVRDQLLFITNFVQHRS
jgi:hypothetical protein